MPHPVVLAVAAENEVLGKAVEALKDQLQAAHTHAATVQRRASEAEAKLHAKAAAASISESQAQVEIDLQRLRHKSANDRILLLQAERGRQVMGQELAAARQQAAVLAQENAGLQEALAAAQRQMRQLESLQVFVDSGKEQQLREQQLSGALDRASSRARELEGRCAALEAELCETAAALQAAQQLADAQAAAAETGSQAARSPHHRGRQEQPHERRRQQQQQREDSLSLSDLCDLDGLQSQMEASPQRSGDGQGGSSGMPSRLALQEQRRQQLEQRHEEEQQEQLDLASSLQHQLLEQQRQLVLLQVQLQQQEAQRVIQRGVADQVAPDGEQAWQANLRHLEAEVDKLKQRNTRLQMVLAEASLQAARAATAAQKDVAGVQEEATRLRQQRDAVNVQLAQLQAAAAAFVDGGTGDGEPVASERLELLYAELVEYAARCNAAVEQNAVLLREKKQWLDKLRAAEGEVERWRAETQQLRLQPLQLLPGGSAGACLGQQHEALVQQVLEAQADEAALRGVLGEAREEQVAACKALASELRRVHALERLRISDMQEQQRLQRRVHDLQKECYQLAQNLVAAQQQVHREDWAIKQQQAASSSNFHIAADDLTAGEVPAWPPHRQVQ